MGGQSVTPKVSVDKEPKVKRFLSTELLKLVKELAVDMHLTGMHCNKHVIKYIFERCNCLILPSVMATWIHMHHVIRMLTLSMFEDLLDYYEVHHTMNGERPMRVTNTVKGYFQDAFALQASCYQDFPNNHEVGIHQMTTFFDKKHDKNNRVCIISSTYKKLLQRLILFLIPFK